MKNVEGKTPKEVFNDLEGRGEDKDNIESLLTQPGRVGARKYVPNIPKSKPKCLPSELKTCRDFTAYVRYYRRGSSHTQATSTTIHGLVYDSEWTLKQIEKDFVDGQDDPQKGKTNHDVSQARKEMKETIVSNSEGRKQEASHNERSDDKDIWRWIHFPANNVRTH